MYSQQNVKQGKVMKSHASDEIICKRLQFEPLIASPQSINTSEYFFINIKKSLNILKAPKCWRGWG